MSSKLHIIKFTSLLSIVMCHIILKRHIDFRDRFLERRRQRQIKDERIMLLDKYLKNTEVIDGITHYRNIEDNSKIKTKRITEIEKDFRRLIAMDGAKYNYKRDMYWRTWRQVLQNDGVGAFVCYKCNNPIQVNATGCHNCGMWTIEERPPPCPYEFFSVIDDHKLCGANYTQYKDVTNLCPSVIKFTDLTASCDNPIETTWRFSKLYGASEEYDNVICGGKDYCEIFTTYEISPEHVVFRIINSTNDVMYSRIMKPNNTNYVCVEDCGRFNPSTRKVAKNDLPLKLDLLSPRKNKREDITNVTIKGIHLLKYLTTTPTVDDFKKNYLSLSKIGGKKRAKGIPSRQSMKKSKLMKRQQNNLDFKENQVEQFLILSDNVPETTTVSHCKKLVKEDEVTYEEEYPEYYVY